LVDRIRRQADASDRSSPGTEHIDEILYELRRVLADIEHGSVTLIVQDGRVVQIDATRKLRLAQRRSVSPLKGE
jgi:hypothetical protein